VGVRVSPSPPANIGDSRILAKNQDFNGIKAKVDIGQRLIYQ